MEFTHKSNFNEITRDSVHQEENVRSKSERKKKLDFGEGHTPKNENNINIYDDSQSPLKKQSKSKQFF